MVDRIAPPNARPVGGTPAAQRVRRNQLQKDRRSQQRQAPDAGEEGLEGRFEGDLEGARGRKGRKGRNIDEHC